MIDDRDVDVVVVGAGPAGSAVAIRLAQAGARVALVEQHAFLRQKVCGECLSAGALAILDELGVGEAVRAAAGPEIRYVGWMGASSVVTAPFPRCRIGAHAFGRAVGRDILDSLLVERARNLGVRILQPARVRQIDGTPGNFSCAVEMKSESAQVWRARVVIDAHGSWEQPLILGSRETARPTARMPVLDSDLFAFKATFTGSTLAPGLLPVIAFPGGYGGVVLGTDGRVTLACCIRRDALRTSRAASPGLPAGLAVASTLQASCPGIAQALAGTRQEIAWLSVGPIRPGIRVDSCEDLFRVGNAAGETHPLIGEGINMALQSARLAAAHVSRLLPSTIDTAALHAANRAYAAGWRDEFGARLRFARWYAHMAMRPTLSNPVNRLLQATPSLMTYAARLAGKARPAKALG